MYLCTYASLRRKCLYCGRMIYDLRQLAIFRDRSFNSPINERRNKSFLTHSLKVL